MLRGLAWIGVILTSSLALAVEEETVVIVSFGPAANAVIDPGSVSLSAKVEASVAHVGSCVGDAFRYCVRVDDTQGICANSSATADGGGTLELGVFPLASDAFSTRITATVDGGQLCTTVREAAPVPPGGNATNETDVSPLETTVLVPMDALEWSFSTVAKPSKSSEDSLNASAVPKQFEVWGVGIFVNDIASIDLTAGTFYGDIDVYALRYYRPFLSHEAALAEATEEDSRGRVCRVQDPARWLFVSSESRLSGDAASLPPLTDVDERLLALINAGKFPKIETSWRSERKVELDHLRVRTEWYFEPELREYPFSQQTLPITLEFGESDALQSQAARSLCLMVSFSGFAPRMSSFSARENAPLSSKAVVSETQRMPPYAPGCESQLDFPPKRGSAACAPSRSTSRLSLEITYSRPTSIGVMTLLPCALIGAGALVSYVLPSVAARLQALATSLLAAVIQHASIRAALPPRAVVTTADEFAFAVYAIIATALLAHFGASVCAAAAALSETFSETPLSQGAVLTSLAPHSRLAHVAAASLGAASPLFLARSLVFRDHTNADRARAWLLTAVAWVLTAAAVVSLARRPDTRLPR